MRTYRLDAVPHAESKLGGVLVRRFHALCGKDFHDALTTHPTVKAAFNGYVEAEDRRAGDNRKGFMYGGITFEEYNVSVSGQAFIPDNVAQVFPVASTVFQVVNAPANYNETVNTLGRDFYARVEQRNDGQGLGYRRPGQPVPLLRLPGGVGGTDRGIAPTGVYPGEQMYANYDDLVLVIPESTLSALTNDAEQSDGPDMTVIERALAGASEVIDGYLRGRYELPLETTPTVLRDLAVALARHDLYARRPEGGMTCPRPWCAPTRGR
uniref:Uncharacterized protein n=1 Tax=Candidatus Kentrum eta TaxID=2126337 RepID=A0A450VI93_9GAMM|nr:MAG: Protein of unknown function (DUF1320) [Candidatus Kentron sp. H]VFK04441.1 MAG: Protein of unknown function (DUF1320) [Candidatus Kentron sp. H]VFK06833.1 MAG: Protein of unknown function (DUF1320) [Candidatus Kentron sp. H]